MTIIEGQIETLKKLKEALSANGINKFSSIADINSFVKSYKNEVKMVPDLVEYAFETELQGLTTELTQHHQKYDELKATVSGELQQEKRDLEYEITLAKEKFDKSFFKKPFYFLKIGSLSRKRNGLENNSKKILDKKTKLSQENLRNLKSKLEELKSNKDKICSDRCNKSLEELVDTKKVIDELYPLIAGAIGESAVLKTLQRLPNDFYLINDYAAKFNPPIYDKNNDDRIFSIQVDHLLVCKAGVFLLETKNWSAKSLQSIDLRSPIEQVLRTSFAMFILLNGDSGFGAVGLEDHHWGSKKIPIRNVIVMTNAKPTEEFKYIKIVSLEQLNGYIQYFDEILSSGEVKSIFNYLKAKLAE